MQHPDEGTIHGWLDHALADAAARRVEAHVAECARCAEMVAEARGLIAAASRLLCSLDAADAQGTTGEPRMSAGRTAGEPRIGADEGGSFPLGSGIRAQGPGVVGEGEGETRRVRRRASWVPRSWAARIAAVFMVAAAGAIAVGEILGPGGAKSLAGSPAATAAAPSQVDSAPSPPSAEAASAAPPAMRRFRVPAPDARDVARAARQRAAQMRTADFLSRQRRSIIRGRVVSTVGRPVAHASVALQGTRFGTMTREDGSYALVVPATLAREKSAVVTVRLIGYQPASKAIALLGADSAAHDFALAPSTLALVSSSTRHDVRGRAVRHSVYEVRPGVQVTVDAMRMTADAPRSDAPKPRGALAERATAPDTVAAPAAQAAQAAIAAGINSIQWTAADGTRFTLSGPLPLAELRTLRPLVR